MTNDIEEARHKRFQFLKRLYEVTEGSRLVSVNLWELGKELGFSRPETDQIDEFLTGEGLIKHIAFGGTISITHPGVIEVENALSKPNEPTTYFPPVNYIHVENMIGSQIQQGTNQSSQVLTYSNNDIEAIRKFVADLKARLSDLNLDVEARAEIESDVSTIEAQVKSPHPKSTVIKECLSSLRTVLEGIAGNTIAAILLQQIKNLP